MTDFKSVVDLVADAQGVTSEQILSPRRGKAPIANARQIAMYLCHCSLRHTTSQIAENFSRQRSTVTHAFAAVEDARDDPNFEEKLFRVEELLKAEVAA